MTRNVFMDNVVPEEEPEIEVEVAEEVPDEVLKRLDEEKDFTTTAAHIKNERLKKGSS